jgi:hypothetical protein
MNGICLVSAGLRQHNKDSDAGLTGVRRLFGWRPWHTGVSDHPLDPAGGL